jgi:hypothetical protein
MFDPLLLAVDFSTSISVVIAQSPFCRPRRLNGAVCWCEISVPFQGAHRALRL